MLEALEINEALSFFEQRISTQEFEYWVKEIYREQEHPKFYFGIGCASGDRVFLCASTLPHTVEDIDLKSCFDIILCKGITLYEKEGQAERDRIRDRQYQIIKDRLNGMGLKCERKDTGYLLEGVYIYKNNAIVY